MQIKEISIERVKNLGNYESIRLTETAVIDEGDDPNKATDDLKFFVEHKLNEDIRATKLAEITDELQKGIDTKGKELTETGIKQRENWIDQYNQEMERFNSLEFMKQ